MLPFNSEVNLKLAGILFREKELYEEAMNFVNKSLEIKNENIEAWLMKAKILEKT